MIRRRDASSRLARIDRPRGCRRGAHVATAEVAVQADGVRVRVSPAPIVTAVDAAALVRRFRSIWRNERGKGGGDVPSQITLAGLCRPGGSGARRMLIEPGQ